MRALPRTAAMILLSCSSALAVADAPTLRELTRAELPAAIKPAGALVHAVAWNDASGHNVVAFWRSYNERKGTALLKITFWSGTPGTKGVVLSKVSDGVRKCQLDVLAEYVADALRLTDLDADGYGELTFAYKTSCAGDVSPATLKLFMLERRNKYVARGTTVVDTGDERVGGERTFDSAFEAEPQFQTHAEGVWKAVVGP